MTWAASTTAPIKAYNTRIDGANMTFEMVAQSPGAVGPREVYYYEVQVRPLDADHLQYAYKSALAWPEDDQGLIQHNPISGTSGELQIAPFLQVTLDESDLPGVEAMTSYGISATQQSDGSYQMILPLVPVERGGKIYALQAKVYQDRASTDSTIRWRDLRLKWAVQGDVLRPADDGSGQMVPSPTGNYGLVIYDEGYQITGVRVSRQAGASAMVAGAYPTANQRFDAGPIALLRAGMEAQYLSGRLSLTDIYDRFNIGNTATITEHWGITQTFRVSQPQNFKHLDELMLNVNVTTTRSILNSVYPGHNYTPTLILATEQRTATLNVDELNDVNFNDLTLNLCVKQIATSRTLKLASYKFDPSAGSLLVASAGEMPYVPSAGDWTMLGLDEVLKDVQKQFDEIYGADRAILQRRADRAANGDDRVASGPDRHASDRRSESDEHYRRVERSQLLRRYPQPARSIWAAQRPALRVQAGGRFPARGDAVSRRAGAMAGGSMEHRGRLRR